MNAVYKEARHRAKRTIKSKWREVAHLRTLGWAGPIEVIQAKFPFVETQISDLVGRITSHLPIFIFGSRESEPSEIELGIPYRDHTGNPFTCRLAAVATQEPPASQVKLLGDFSQALWFCLEQGMLPSPRAGDALQETLVTWTGEELFRL